MNEVTLARYIEERASADELLNLYFVDGEYICSIFTGDNLTELNIRVPDFNGGHFPLYSLKVNSTEKTEMNIWAKDECGDTFVKAKVTKLYLCF